MLTNENYFDRENEKKYMGSTQFKNFCECEARTLAEINGEWDREEKTAFLEGQYVEACFEGNENLFAAQHPEMVSSKGPTKGQLKAAFKHLDNVVEYGKADEFFMKFITGENQIIKTGEIAGVPFKIKIDVNHDDKIVDLKAMKDFKPVWTDDKGKVSFIEAYGYDIQGAIYQAVEGNNKPFILAALTKEKPQPDKALIQFSQDELDAALEEVEAKAPKFQMIKEGILKPTGCGKCDYCKAHKKLDRVITTAEM